MTSNEPLKFGLLSLVLAASLANNFGTASATQKAPDRRIVLIDSFPLPGLPLGISNASLVKTGTGYVLKLSLSNSSNEQILGLRYWLLILSPANNHWSEVDHSVSVRLNPDSMKDVFLQTPPRLRIQDDDRVFLVLSQVISRDSIWEALRAKDALEAYAKDGNVKMPNVWRFPNEVDSPPRLSIIY